MVSLTQKEKQALLTLLKEFSAYYNANSLSKVLGMSRIGTMKMLKKLAKINLLIKKNIAKSTVYRVNLEDEYTRKLLSFLLADEAHKFKRWKDEFKNLSKPGRIVMMYGSAIRDYSKANDIDLMLVIEKSEYREVKKAIAERQAFLAKKIHPIELTKQDFFKGIKNNKAVMEHTIKNAIILNGEDKYVEILKDVTTI
jgi:hypothetical protein